MSDQTVYQVRWEAEDGDGKWLVRKQNAKKPSRVFYESDYRNKDITAQGRAKLEAKRLARNNCPAQVDFEGTMIEVC